MSLKKKNKVSIIRDKQVNFSLSSEEQNLIASYIRKYKISNKGRVRSLPRACYEAQTGKKNRNIAHRLISLSNDGRGYYQAFLDSIEGHRIAYVHRLVALYFVKGRSNINTQVHHIDEDVSNNHYTNLEWLSMVDHMARHDKEFREYLEQLDREQLIEAPF